MQTIFNAETIKHFQSRIGNLTERSSPQWGKMSATQMLKHCTENEKLYLRKRPFRRLFMGRLFGKMILKKLIRDEAPLPKNQPTHPDLKIMEGGGIEGLKKEWSILLEEYLQKGHQSYADFIHPFFGKMTEKQVGIHAYKHVDHHLRQFGV